MASSPKEVNNYNVYMLESCDTTITADISFHHSGVLHSQRDSLYPNDVECRMTITTERDQLLLLVFEEFDIEGDIDRTCFDALWYFDGAANSSQALLENGEELCGLKREIGNLISNGQTVDLLLKTDQVTRKDGFRLVYTSFHTGPCNESEFRCANGRCIIDQLVNNTHDNCGDRSDELDTETLLDPPKNGKIAELGIGLIIGIAVTASIGLLILVVCTVCIVYHAICSKILCKNHHSNGREGKDGEETVVASAAPLFRSSSRVGGLSINDREHIRDAWM